MTASKINILCWNVRGLNRPARRDAIHELLAATLCHVACLQETKLNTIDQFTASYLGGHRLKNFAYKPAGGPSETRGGILLLWNDNYVDPRDIVIQEFHISATVISRENSNSFLLTVVYWPSRYTRK
jgi:exonuclease III